MPAPFYRQALNPEENISFSIKFYIKNFHLNKIWCIKMKKLLLIFFFVLGLLFGGLGQVYAQSGVGKLAGKVIDASTKEPLIGANVVIVGSELGAATNVDGKYFVLNIVPGTYEVKVSFVGYSPKVIKNVRVVAGITYELNVELQTGVALNEIVITGEKKFFEEKSTNSTKVIDANEISRLPVKGVEKLASLQAGVVMADGSGGASGNATINVRGGRSNEVLYIVDGVAQNDLYGGGNGAQLSNSAIDQISFEIGGYEAKYGSAQSGIINVTTKSGEQKYSLFGDVQTSSFTDDYGYNLYTVNLGGPIIPGNPNHTMFLSAERGWFLDSNPRAIALDIPTIGLHSSTLPNDDASVWRYTFRTYHNLSPFSLRLGANINTRDYRAYSHAYAKNNSMHNPLRKTRNYSYSARLSDNISPSSFWNLNVGYKVYSYQNGDGIWFDNLENYGSVAANTPYFGGTFLTALQNNQLHDGFTGKLDATQLFYEKGTVYNLYQKQNTASLTADLDFTSQIDNHLIEVGGGFNYSVLRFFAINPASVAVDADTKSYEERLALQQPYFFGYDITSKNFASGDEYKTYGGKSSLVKAAPKKPVVAYAYLQDRFELSDLILNIGVRMDYFDSKVDMLKNPNLPYAGGTDPTDFDAGDFTQKKAEVKFSPRIGIGFPISTSTVFHAQYGKFVQPPDLQDVYTSISALRALIADNNLDVNIGNVGTEVTTQYEVGFRQILGNNVAALNITAFYKNTVGLVSTIVTNYQRAEGGQVFRYYGPSNGDFGTVKGLAMSLTVARMSYFSLSLDYTYSLSEGTGSSSSSAATAAFRNTGTDPVPIVIAPLDFDQRHTGVATLDFYVPKGDLGWLEGTSLSLIYSFNSGRPYTPLAMQNITPGGGTNYGETKGYVNSSYGPSSSRLDLKLEKSFTIFDKAVISPYLWVENVLNTENAVSVYRSTGSPYTSGYLSTAEGSAVAQDRGQAYVDDYTALERNPTNFGIPRLIKLGVKVNFSGITL